MARRGAAGRDAAWRGVGVVAVDGGALAQKCEGGVGPERGGTWRSQSLTYRRLLVPKKRRWNIGLAPDASQMAFCQHHLRIDVTSMRTLIQVGRWVGGPVGR